MRSLALVVVLALALSSASRPRANERYASDAFAMRLISGGGLIISSGDQILRLNGSADTQTYTIFGKMFALSADLTSTSFWIGSIDNPNLYKLNMATGIAEQSIKTELPDSNRRAPLGYLARSGGNFSQVFK